jgi:F420-non-reducing hydrogenase iron-sulfur subunit
MIPIRVMCSGRVDPAFVLKALAGGADGVLIAGCHPPADCHYQSGNIKAMRRHSLLLRTLEQFGVERERVRLEWISASEGPKFAQVMEEMREVIKGIGPLEWASSVKRQASYVERAL